MPNIEKFTYYLPRNTKNRKQNMVLNSNDRLNRFARMETTQKLRALAAYQESGRVFDPYTAEHPARLILTVCPPTRQDVDPPNLYPTFKALIDGLTDAGVWEDDNNRIILETIFRYGGTSGKKGHYKLEIIAMPCASMY